MVSITDPISPAIAHAKRILFEPFDLRKWFVLGFCAFLANLGSGGGSYNYNGNPFDRTNRGARPDFQAVTSWIGEHLPLVIALGILLFVVILALTVLFQWLSSRGQFMFLDGVAHDRAEIAEPWTRFRTPGNQVFRFRLMLMLVGLALFLVCGGLGVLIALPDIHARTFGSSALTALVGAGGLLVLGSLALGVLSLLLRDFVVPIMYRRGLDTSAAWAVLREELLPGHTWHFVGFYLMTLLLWIPASLLILVACCLTCCVALLPYLSSVVCLPLFVFFRCYSLGFLEQFGDDWRIIETTEPQI
ncbi:hypothetical protein GETHLI_01640 [Geothrix limicola]|uniref:DUF4013 domain-containing protein n=1 Tax=Geothrix limicola TaxID=2927978 RepID=A0ABQ5QA11_9BACT|nr:hypothetical protein [Geothrix limicola]GLH71662.1 hypothetical protein GETHLI_01640 [Geothrix limicola]